MRYQWDDCRQQEGEPRKSAALEFARKGYRIRVEIYCTFDELQTDFDAWLVDVTGHLAEATRRLPAALQRRSLDCPWHTPRAEIVRLRGVPINRDAEEVKHCRSLRFFTDEHNNSA